jgi:hypothetical protein
MPSRVHDTIRHAREGFRMGGRGCIVANMGAEQRYATVSQLVRRLYFPPEAKMLITGRKRVRSQFSIIGPSRTGSFVTRVAKDFSIG